MSVKPLSWPESMQHPLDLEGFMVNLPVFGANKRAYRQFRKEVAARDARDCRSLWTPYMHIISVRDKVFDALEDTMGWRSRNFIPADPIAILLFHPGMWFGGEDAFLTQVHLMRLFKGCQVLKILKRCKDKTLGELVDALALSGPKDEEEVAEA